MDNLSAYLFQELRKGYPSIDWSLGSVSRELWLEPLAAMSDVIDNYVVKAKNSLNIEALCANPEAHYDELKDMAKALGVTKSNAVAGSGTVSIMLNSAVDISISKGTQFYWLDYIVSVPYTVYGTADKNKTVKDAVVVNFRDLSGGCYELEVPVETFNNYNATLDAGVPLNWANAPRSVYDIRVKSAISGGHTEDSPTELATKIQATMFPPAYTGTALLSSALTGLYPQYFNSCIIGEPENSKACVFIKPKQAPGVDSIDVVFTESDSEMRCTLVDIQGLLSIDRVCLDGVGDVSYKIKVNKTNTTNSIDITVDKNNVKHGFVYIKRYKQYDYFYTALNQALTGLPYKYELVTPQTKYVTLNIPCTGSESSKRDLQAALQKRVNDLPLTTTNLTDALFTPILERFGVVLSGPIYYSVTSAKNVIESGSESFSPKSAGSVPIAYWSSVERIVLNYV